MLIDAVAAWAREAGARHIALDVTDGDSPAMRLYTRAGFRPSGDPQPLRPGSPLLRQPMRLALSPEACVPDAFRLNVVDIGRL